MTCTRNVTQKELYEAYQLGFQVWWEQLPNCLQVFQTTTTPLFVTTFFFLFNNGFQNYVKVIYVKAMSFKTRLQSLMYLQTQEILYVKINS
jgi:hypothetical protein